MHMETILSFAKEWLERTPRTSEEKGAYLQGLQDALDTIRVWQTNDYIDAVDNLFFPEA